MAIVYVIVAFWGDRANTRIAEAFGRTHCAGDSSIFQRQFAMCGAGDHNASGRRALLLKESSYTFKFYASGRRYCEGCLATLMLRCRPDLMSWALQLFVPDEDLLELEVYMNEAVMPTTVLAIGTPRQAKALSSRADVGSFAKPVKPNSGSIPPGADFPNKKLQVLAEHSGLFTELLTDPRVAEVFSNPAHLRLFRSLLVTSDASGPNRRLLRLVLAMPGEGDMKALGPLLAMLPALIDIVGTYKLSPEHKKRAQEARAKAEAASTDAEELRKRRLEALQQRKIEKALEEKMRLARMDPEARRKAEEKLAAKAAKKSIRMKMVRQ
ncbi:hypothetical protein GPECTOR_496g451 [Gonium pectorale]|uniref:DUF1682 domain-containing protein n=1 Tax=Gonium pectorale TaxID=33097 RepID=A0A150FW13_GONPE|nr:hypothetical protein GPECTOR_496g451 [Gonium pectorale]|eukprot:KXZ41395.1 hypothetical protein GPECTOR_496g451 [Gonium pectorale]